jgi:uncharacterized protein YdaU (DUF1376 family)
VNYYPFHIGDYTSATRHLSWDEDAAYRRLLDVYYTTEKPLPSDLRAVCRLVLATTEAQREAVKIVLEEFFVLSENGWVNARADREIDAMRDKQQKQREKAAKRWHKPEPEPGNAAGMPQHQSGDATALKTDADAMPPTPTPTPTPTPIILIQETTSLLSADENPPTQSPALPTCPHRALIDLYHAKLPTLPRVRTELWDGQKAEHLRARWKWVLTAKRDGGQRYATSENEALAWFGRFFDAVSESDFLSGRNGKWTACNFAWLVKADNFAKVVQGSYENRSAR